MNDRHRSRLQRGNYVYILRCADGTLYTGWTTDPERRTAAHNAGKGAKYTKARRPVELVYIEEHDDKIEAQRREYEIKQFSRAEKEELIRKQNGRKSPKRRRIMTKVYCYSKCSTCKKALKWLDDKKIEYKLIDIKEKNPDEKTLRSIHKKSGMPLRKFFNTSGQLYRQMELSKKLPDMSEDEMFALLASDGMLVKRPLVISGNRVLTGFREADWEATLL